jgi:hypothetical protein
MSFTKIQQSNIANNTVLPVHVSAAFEAEYAKQAFVSAIANTANTANTLAGGILKITTVNVANSTYAVLDDTAVNVGGGYLVISGSGFATGAQVLIDTTPATSTTFVNSSTLRAEVPAKTAATYNLYVVNTDGGTAIRVNGLTYSGIPTWVTGSTLANVVSNTAFTGNISATGATSYANTTALPAGFNLVTANGYYFGNISVGSATTYSFTIEARDAELQDSPRTFSLTTVVSNAPTTVEYIVVAGGGGGHRSSSPNGGFGGGGGAGGLLTGNLSVTTATSYTVTVGGGGTAQSSNGSNSVFHTITSWGGGLGGTNTLAGQNGGSGGGVYTGGTVGRGIYPGSPFISAARQGYDGGTATPNYQGGGGGGAGAVPANNLAGGEGLADGSLNGILAATSTGVVSPSPGARYIAGGGGGGGGGAQALGGLGGGGNGGFGINPGQGSSGTTNSGGGGGGGNYGTPSYFGGSGGSGIVIIRYPSSFDVAASTTGSPTVSTAGGYRYYVFTGSGSITW